LSHAKQTTPQKRTQTTARAKKKPTFGKGAAMSATAKIITHEKFNSAPVTQVRKVGRLPKTILNIEPFSEIRRAKSIKVENAAKQQRYIQVQKDQISSVTKGIESMKYIRAAMVQALQKKQGTALTPPRRFAQIGKGSIMLLTSKETGAVTLSKERHQVCMEAAWELESLAYVLAGVVQKFDDSAISPHFIVRGIAGRYQTIAKALISALDDDAETTKSLAETILVKPA